MSVLRSAGRLVAYSANVEAGGVFAALHPLQEQLRLKDRRTAEHVGVVDGDRHVLPAVRGFHADITDDAHKSADDSGI